MQVSPPVPSRHPWGDEETPYLAVGGESGVRALVEAFYDTIEAESPLLRAMLPANTKNTRQKLFMYLTGWLGGPPLYEERWGHPKLRMRHAPFPIGETEAAEWMRCMQVAMDQVEMAPQAATFLIDRFGPLADHMRNR